MATNTNAYCEALGVATPRLEDFVGSRNANTYALLVVALLERGAPMTLVDVAQRIRQATGLPAERALLALKRCRPARLPVYRDADEYALDPYGDELFWCAFRLGLNPTRTSGVPFPCSSISGIAAPEGKASDADLVQRRHVIAYAFPEDAPRAVALLDVYAREITTYINEDISQVREQLAGYDVIAAIDVRTLLRTLKVDPLAKTLAELGPPQKAKTLDKRGRKLKITTEMLISHSCGISRPLGDRKKLAEYLRTANTTRLRRRLEANVKSLFAYYEYGLLHDAVRLRWGFLDEFIPAPWARRDGGRLAILKSRALASNVYLEVVVGSAPGWADPWARARRCIVTTEPGSFWTRLIGEDGEPIDEDEVQSARLSEQPVRPYTDTSDP